MTANHTARQRPVRNSRRLIHGLLVIFIAVLGAGVTASAGDVQAPGAGGVPVSPDAAPAPSDAVSLPQAIEAYRIGAPLHAMDAFVQIARANPNSAFPVIWAGIAAIAGEKYPEAEMYFREALRRPHTAFQDRITQGWLDRLSVLREVAKAPVPVGTPRAIAQLARASNPRLTWNEALRTGQYVFSAAQKHGLDPWLLAAVVYIESRFNQRSISRRGATGFGQLMPQTARAAGVDPRDPWGNLLGTAMTLRGNYLEFHNWNLALAAYNAGDTAVRRFGGVPPYAETRWYVTAVWAVYNRIRPSS